MSISKRECASLARLIQARRAATALEFAIVFPVALLILMAILGVGIASFYQMALDDAVRVAARQVKLGGPASLSASGFVSAVCAQFGRVVNNCATAITYNIQATAASGTFASLPPLSMPSAGALADIFPVLAAGQNVVIQVAYPLPFKLPYIGPAITLTGTNSILSTTTVHLEPFA